MTQQQTRWPAPFLPKGPPVASSGGRGRGKGSQHEPVRRNHSIELITTKNQLGYHEAVNQVITGGFDVVTWLESVCTYSINRWISYESTVSLVLSEEMRALIIFKPSLPSNNSSTHYKVAKRGSQNTIWRGLPAMCYTQNKSTVVGHRESADNGYCTYEWLVLLISVPLLVTFSCQFWLLDSDCSLTILRLLAVGRNHFPLVNVPNMNEMMSPETFTVT